ncbi:MAG: hypothetical protein CMN56_00330 [Sneathiella sp.]|uniref:hypothetical protein n=1 Tax=Sneathiella sp. TaxID=1964365 RepID=UPI000C41CBFF|nr:hypothetical protein [Sneathiella sp.]MAZ01566.1 hypothetical protein [Sneathiella sp.]
MKKLLLGSLLLAFAASPALAQDGRFGGLPGGTPTGYSSTTGHQIDAVVGTNYSSVSIGNTTGTVTVGGQYSVNAVVSHIGPNVVQQGFANVDLHAPTFGDLDKAGEGGGHVYNGPSNAAVVSQTLEKNAIAFDTLRREDGLTDIIQSLLEPQQSNKLVAEATDTADAARLGSSLESASLRADIVGIALFNGTIRADSYPDRF